MKNKQFIIVFLLGLFYFSISLNAQVNLSGNLGLNYVKSGDYSKVLSYNMTPKIGFEINNNVVFGGLIGYRGFSLKYQDYYYYDIFEIDETIGVINIGVYSRFNTTKSDKIRLLFEPALTMGIESENYDLMLSFVTVPVVQFRITEKVFFDMTLGLMGLSVVSIPDSEFLEFNFGLNNHSVVSDIGLLGIAGSTLIPIQVGLTFSL